MSRVLIIADDLTGACDTGVAFAGAGVETVVTIRGGDGAAAPGAADVLVIDTESRHSEPAEAAARVRDAARRGLEAGVEFFYKKTDSTLRGNIGAELESLMSALSAARLAFIPAFPATGRTTRGGRLYVNGVPLGETAFADDPRAPVRESDVAAIIRRQTKLPVTVISPREPDARASFAATDRGIVVFDCEDDSDARRIAALLTAENALGLTAGSGGFASGLASCIDLPRTAVRRGAYDGPLLVVCGSAHPASQAQVDFALRRGFREIAPPPERAREARLVREAARRGAQGANVVIRAAHGAVGGRVAAELARFAAHCLRRGPFGACVVFGGDTAREVMLAVGAGAIRPRFEIVPGIVLSECAALLRRFALVTKAGGFGDKDVLVRIADVFTASA